eukprot:363893-Chlamydomonas_euryale.AAC.10
MPLLPTSLPLPTLARPEPVGEAPGLRCQPASHCPLSHPQSQWERPQTLAVNQRASPTACVFLLGVRQGPCWVFTRVVMGVQPGPTPGLVTEDSELGLGVKVLELRRKIEVLEPRRGIEFRAEPLNRGLRLCPVGVCEVQPHQGLTRPLKQIPCTQYILYVWYTRSLGGRVRPTPVETLGQVLPPAAAPVAPALSPRASRGAASCRSSMTPCPTARRHRRRQSHDCGASRTAPQRWRAACCRTLTRSTGTSAEGMEGRWGWLCTQPDPASPCTGVLLGTTFLCRGADSLAGVEVE